MRVLITGGAGFIGSHLATRLLEMDHEVSIVDDLSTGSMRNLEHIKDNVAFEYHLDTIFNRRLMAEQVDLADLVFHLAAAVGVRRIIDMPVQTIETNVRGSEVMFEMTSKKQKRLLITSTSEVYGKSNKLPFQETDDMVFGSTYNCRWSYACSKAIDEFLALAYHREHKLPVTVVRLFNTAGPRQTGRYGMVLPSFVKQALQGEPITVYGTGQQSRCFGHIDDVLDGLIACSFSNRTAGEIFNLGSTEEVTIKDLADRIIAATGSKSEIRYVRYEDAYGPGFEDMERRIPDISKAKDWFGFSPKRTLSNIITDVVQDVRQRPDRAAKRVAHAA